MKVASNPRKTLKPSYRRRQADEGLTSIFSEPRGVRGGGKGGCWQHQGQCLAAHIAGVLWIVPWRGAAGIEPVGHIVESDIEVLHQAAA
jgi:hypothetical protein